MRPVVRKRLVQDLLDAATPRPTLEKSTTASATASATPRNSSPQQSTATPPVEIPSTATATVVPATTAEKGAYNYLKSSLFTHFDVRNIMRAVNILRAL
jgi:hypothetical protein